jgi:hypothetical protein
VGELYTINSEDKFTQSSAKSFVEEVCEKLYNKKRDK